MCEESRFRRWADTTISRRGFSAAGGAGLIAACAPVAISGSPAGAIALRERPVRFASRDGTMDGFFVHPAAGKAPGVVFWPDIAGLREAKRIMARRLAAAGYSVLVLNPYYRDVAGERFSDFADFVAGEGFAKVKPWREKLDATAIMRDAASAIAWLDAQDEVDAARRIGTQGYCMGGPFAVWTSAAVPARVGAAASFHGGGLVRDGQSSPHRLMQQRTAYLIAIAQDDEAVAGL